MLETSTVNCTLNFSFFAAIIGKLESLTPDVKEDNLDKASEVLTT